MRSQQYTPRRARRRRRRPTPLLPLLALAAVIFAALLWWRSDTAPSPEASTSEVESAASLQPDSEADASSEQPEEEVPPSEEALPSQEEEEPEDAASTEPDLLMLVNSTHPLPEDYEVALTLLSNGQQVATAIYPALQQMFDDARAQGVYPVVASGFRTAEKQQSLMEDKIASFLAQGYDQEAAETEALKWVNAVGCSEHQSGLAVDINADGVHSTGTQVYQWLADNAWRYGFILRYPEGKTDLTGTDYEPWHYRYVGQEAAAALYEQGVCLEEYLGE